MQSLSIVRQLERSSISVALLFSAIALAGCSGREYNKQLLCEVKGDSGALQFIQYEQNDYPNLPQAGGHGVYVGVNFKSSGLFGNSRWLMRRIYDNSTPYAFEACKDSSILGDNIMLYPLHRHYDSGNSLDRNRAIISTDGGARFNLMYFPESGYPYLLDSAGKSLVYSSWITRDISAESLRIKVTQITFMLAPFYDGTGKKLVRNDLMDWLDLKGKDCDECSPVIFRDVESIDGGKSWKITNFGVLRPDLIPKDTQPLLAKNVYRYARSFDQIVRKESDPREGRLLDCPVDIGQLADEHDKDVCGLRGRVIPLK